MPHDKEDWLPPNARIDAPGALHHLIIRGIERRRIFFDLCQNAVLNQAKEGFEERYRLQTKVYGFEKATNRVTTVLGIEPDQVRENVNETD